MEKEISHTIFKIYIFFYFQKFTLQTVVDMKRVSWSQSAML